MRAFDALPRLAELSLRVAREAGSLTLSIVRQVAEPILKRGNGADSGDSGWPRTSEPPPSRPVGDPPAPAHVGRDAVLVAEFADAGAEDGAGAQISVDEPWDGYAALNAKHVVARLASADAATLAVVRLYESSHRKRRTVLAEVDSRLATAGD